MPPPQCCRWPRPCERLGLSTPNGAGLREATSRCACSRSWIRELASAKSECAIPRPRGSGSSRRARRRNPAGQLILLAPALPARCRFSSRAGANGYAAGVSRSRERSSALTKPPCYCYSSQTGVSLAGTELRACAPGAAAPGTSGNCPSRTHSRRAVVVTSCAVRRAGSRSDHPRSSSSFRAVSTPRARS